MKLVRRLIVITIIGFASTAHSQLTIETFQKFRTDQTLQINGTNLQLTNLNSNVNSWYLLAIQKEAKHIQYINLENARAPEVSLRLGSDGLEFVAGNKVIDTCADWMQDLQKPDSRTLPFAPICNNRVFVRNHAKGYEPTIEWGAEFVREHLGSFSESVINAAKETVFKDKYAEDADSQIDADSVDGSGTKALRPALLEKKFNGLSPKNQDLGIALAKEVKASSIRVGEWYPAQLQPGIFVSIVAPGMVSQSILSSYRDRVNELQAREMNSLVYLVAFDMKHYRMGWAHGTSLPGIGWSDRVTPAQIKAFGGGAGPDGIDSFDNLINPGQVPPSDWPITVATISGGFQKHHSQFPHGYYSTVNKSTHFGFIDDGVMMASPNPGLSTVIGYTDGSFAMKTWTEKDNQELSRIRYLRQNDLPLIEPDAQGNGIPGAYVGNRHEGNWSGSAKKDNYTPRGGACLIERNGEQYFVYGYFSAATPSAMARVFQAYGCKQAIHLDMNSPGQAYLALISFTKDKVVPQYLVRRMKEADPAPGVPRYFSVPDFRDFFWLMKR